MAVNSSIIPERFIRLSAIKTLLNSENRYLMCSLLDCNYDGLSDREKRIFVDVVVKRDTLYYTEKMKLTEEERNLLWDMLENPDNIKDGKFFDACFNKIREKWLYAE